MTASEPNTASGDNSDAMTTDRVDPTNYYAGILAPGHASATSKYSAVQLDDPKTQTLVDAVIDEVTLDVTVRADDAEAGALVSLTPEQADELGTALKVAAHDVREYDC